MSKIQNNDIKSESELISDGGAKSQLPNDDKVYVTANALNKTLKEAITDGDLAGGGGESNFLEGDDFDFNTSIGNWVTFADTAQDTPTDGTGGTATSTLTRNTTTPLEGGGDAVFSKPASNEQGEGASVDFSINRSDQAQIVTVKIAKKNSSNYQDGRMGVFIYDRTNANIIRCNTGEDILAGNGDHYATFQTAIDSTDYRLILFVKSTDTDAYTLTFDQVVINRIPLAFGVYDSDVKCSVLMSASQTISSTSQTKVDFDTVVVDNTSSFNTSLNRFVVPKDGDYDVNASLRYDNISNLESISVYIYVDGSIEARVLKRTNTNIDSVDITKTLYNLNEGQYIEIFAFNPGGNYEVDASNQTTFLNITKRYSTDNLNGLQKSQVFGNREVFTRIENTVTQSVNSTLDVDVEFNNAQVDKTNIADIANDRIVFNESGLYIARANLAVASGTGTYYIAIAKNGNLADSYNYASSTTANGGALLSTVTILDVNAGDNCSAIVRRYGSSSGSVYNVNSARLEVTKLSNPQTLLERPTVGARYTTDSGQSFSTGTTVVFEDKNYDTDNAYDTTTGIYTIKYSGFYVANFAITTASTTWSTNNLLAMELQRNGNIISIPYYRFPAGYTGIASLEYSDTAYFNEGDEVRVVGSLSGPASINLIASAGFSQFSIQLIK